MYLVTPEELVAIAVLETIPDVQKLRDAVCSDVIGVLSGLIPGERCPEEEEAHGDWRDGRLTSTSGSPDNVWADAGGCTAL